MPRILLSLILVIPASTGRAQEARIPLTPDMVTSESPHGNPEAMVDEQSIVGDPPTGKPEKAWEVNSRFSKEFPCHAYLDLGRERNLSHVWVYDTFNVGELVVSAGKPGDWKEAARYETRAFQHWAKAPLDVTTRYLRLTRVNPSCIFAEIALYEYTPEAIEARRQRAVALERAQEEARNRPSVDVGPPFGRLPLVDEIDCSRQPPDHEFVEEPAGASRVETILGRPCRVLRKTPGEAAYCAYRIGRWKLLRPGTAYVLAVEYPEDAPRTVVILNGGNETGRGFHTGNTFGDAFHPKYVNNNSESLRAPLSGKYETWKLFFHLHDRFPNVGFIRGEGRRELTPEDGFTVAVAQFSAANIPASHGAAVSRIRLFEVPDPARLTAEVHFPPEGLPRRHVFWREEMADGVIAADKEEDRGLKQPLDWYRYKASTMKLLGIRTFTKDLLEFGACQGWDSSPLGGNDWGYYNWRHKDYWAAIVEIVGREGFDVLPYYEYSGSKGKNGLGPQRRAKPLTRDDAYTHITWIESANADITDPDTYADFQKMLDLTIVRLKDKARFVGAWLRPRAQLPIGFGDATRARFAKEANQGRAVGRKDLIDNKALLGRYYEWWYQKRREFLVAMRDYLRHAGVNPEAVVLFTADPSESGVSFPTWDKQFVTDDVAGWIERLKSEEVSEGKEIHPIAIDEVISRDLYLGALLAPRLNWGGWEVDHSSPPADPERYKDTDGVLMTHGINRAYTVGSPKTFDAFRGPSGLAVVRHHSLNENMMFDKADRPRLGYFVADIERAGPYCVLAETRAVANGDPRFLGYLVGSNFGRGFPEYVRNFNLAFLALPALPSRIVHGAASDPEVVVRAIPTDRHGTWLAVANTGLTHKPAVAVRLPRSGRLTDAATGELIAENAGQTTLSMCPCQLRALRVE